MDATVGIAPVDGAYLERIRVRRRFWRRGPQGSDINWALAFLVPYAAVFLLFVVYPVGYGLWLGHRPASYQALFRSDLSAHRCQHADLPGDRGEPASVRRAAAVRLLHAPQLASAIAAAGLHAALGGAGNSDLHRHPLDAERRVGIPQQPAVRPVRHQRPVLAELPLARDGLGHRVVHLEMDAVLDGDLPGRAHGDPAGTV